MSQRALDWLSAGMLLALGLSHLAFAVLAAGFALGFGGIFALLAIREQDVEPMIGGAIFGGMGTLLAVVFLVQALPALVGGVALFWRKDWARVLGIVAGALSLANVPVGTVLGGVPLCLLLYGWIRRGKGEA